MRAELLKMVQEEVSALEQHARRTYHNRLNPNELPATPNQVREQLVIVDRIKSTSPELDRLKTDLRLSLQRAMWWLGGESGTIMRRILRSYDATARQRWEAIRIQMGLKRALLR